MAADTATFAGKATPSTRIAARVGAVLLSAAGWSTVAVVAGSPWLRGGLPPRAIAWISVGGGFAFALWVVGSVLARRRPGVPVVRTAVLTAALALGWGMTVAARATYEGPGKKFEAATTLGGWGSLDFRASRDAMLPVSAAGGILIIIASMSRERTWRWRIVSAVVASGAALAGYGLLARSGIAPELVHRGVAEGPSPLGPFRHHGIAGTYLNLVMALALASGMVASLVGRRSWAILAFVAAAICLAGAIVNVSKAGMALAVVVVLIEGVVIAALLRGARIGARLAVSTVLAAIVVAGAAFLLSEEGRQRWAAYMETPSVLGGRGIMWRIATPMAADAGVFGYGPGSFKLMLPHSPHFDRELYSNWIVTEHVPGTEISQWSYACNDYLQGMIEWGWLGFALWAGVIGGAVAFAVRGALKRDLSTSDRLLLVGVLAGIGSVLIHATVDWPLQAASIQVTVAALLGLAWGCRSWVDGQRSRECASC